MNRPAVDTDTSRDLAAILARGFLRLTDIARSSAVSSARDPQSSLDVSRRESPHVSGTEGSYEPNDAR
jgi:hypothetical protein